MSIDDVSGCSSIEHVVRTLQMFVLHCGASPATKCTFGTVPGYLVPVAPADTAPYGKLLIRRRVPPTPSQQTGLKHPTRGRRKFFLTTFLRPLSPWHKVSHRFSHIYCDISPMGYPVATSYEISHGNEYGIHPWNDIVIPI